MANELGEGEESINCALWPGPERRGMEQLHSLVQKCDLETSVRDMQVLFQVNRLIIDRSILLLLSASKCCLRRTAAQPAGGSDRPADQRAFEVRHCVSVQIRVSISIIMAIVRCSVFGRHQLKQLPAWAAAAPTRDNCPERIDNNQQPAEEGSSSEEDENENTSDSALWEQRPIKLASQKGARARLEVLDYFLLTSSGTLSAHDAISSLKQLIEPFTTIASPDELARELDLAFRLACDINQANPALRSRQRNPQGDQHKESQHQHQQQAQRPNSRLACLQEITESSATASQQRPACSQHERLLEAVSKPQVQSVLLMDKRQLVRALNTTFLGELRMSLVERLHEFTDCPYVKHEHRELIVGLLTCVKVLLNKFVKLIYRLRRRVASPNEMLQLSQLRQLASQLDDTCAELHYELLTSVIEQSDELDRLNSDLDLLRQIKHHCLVGDTTKAQEVFQQFHEQCEQLLELCRMLNQVSPTNKMKISTKTLAIWFESNWRQLMAVSQSLSERPHCRVSKECAWAYIQVWRSFYDDFCQLARQLAYLAHSHFEPERSRRVALIRDQIEQQRREQQRLAQFVHRSRAPAEPGAQFHRLAELEAAHFDEAHLQQAAWQAAAYQRYTPVRSSPWIGSVQSLNNMPLMSERRASQNAQPPLAAHYELEGLEPAERDSAGYAAHLDRGRVESGRPANSLLGADSPRSLDHYRGFGANYPRAGSRHNHRDWHADAADQSAGGGSGSQKVPAALHLSGPSSDLAGVWPEVASLDAELEQVAALQRAAAETGLDMQQRLRDEAIWRRPEATLGAFAPLEAGRPSGGESQNRCPGSSCVGCGQEASGFPAQTINFAANQSHFPGAPIHHEPPRVVCVETSAPPLEPPIVPARRAPGPGPDSAAGGPKSAQHSARTNRARQRAPAEGRVPLAELSEERLGDANGSTTAGEDSSEVELAGSRSPKNKTIPASQHKQSIASISSSADQPDKWSDSEADAIVRGARETAQMALSMYQFTRGEGDLNTTQDLFTQAELFAEEANELYKEVRCFSYKVPAGDLKRELLGELATIPAFVQQLQFTVKNPTVGKAATFTKVDSVIRETKSLMEAVNRVVEATLSCRQHYNMASASMRKRTRTLSPSYSSEKGFDFEGTGGGRSGGHSGAFGRSGQSGFGRATGAASGGFFGGRHATSSAGHSMGSEPDI